MKNFFLISAVLLCITQNSIEQNGGANTPPLKTRPPYHVFIKNTPYYVDKKIDNFITTKSITIQDRPLNATDEIIFAFDLISQEACLFFTKTETLVENSTGINFKVGNKNEVKLSNSLNSPTIVSLQENVYRNATSLKFYIGLAMGLIPEVGRPDRENDVNVDINNVDDDHKQYYNISKPDDVPYLRDTNFDFNSAMFFGSDFGVLKDKKSTYTVKLYENYQYSSSVSKSFSHNDYKHMYYYYCDGSNKSNNCKNGGYPIPENLSKCKCPYYLTGDKCEKFYGEDYTINWNAKRKTNFSLIANDTEECVKVNLTDELFFLNVTSQDDNKNVSIVIEELTFERTNCNIGRSYLEIFIREDKGAAGMNFCRNITNITLPPLSNKAFFVFKAYKENTSLSISYKQV